MSALVFPNIGRLSFASFLDFCFLKIFQDYDVFTRQKCDTFSRSSDAVFELSTRFVEPFTHAPGLSEEQELEKERLMFLELTQGKRRAAFYLITII